MKTTLEEVLGVVEVEAGSAGDEVGLIADEVEVDEAEVEDKMEA